MKRNITIGGIKKMSTFSKNHAATYVLFGAPKKIKEGCFCYTILAKIYGQ